MILENFNDMVSPLVIGCLEMRSSSGTYAKVDMYLKVPNKLAHIGLWHYQGYMVLKSGDP
eukprot:9235079-Ditylum_brightwellii.AAC.1